ncbi:hypothetical protein [Phenylobacterium sp.]|nr:hypothetical protein [Phenylobacterium sp.]
MLQSGCVLVAGDEPGMRELRIKAVEAAAEIAHLTAPTAAC